MGRSKSVTKSWKTKELITAAAVMLAVGSVSGCAGRNIKYDGRFPKSAKQHVEQTHRFSEGDSEYYQSVLTKLEKADLERKVSFSTGMKERFGETYEYTLEKGNTISVVYGLEPYFTIISEDNELNERIYFSKGENREFLSVYSLMSNEMLDVSLGADRNLEVWNGSQRIKYDSTLDKYIQVLRNKYGGIDFMEISRPKGKKFMESIIENEYKKYKQILKIEEIASIHWQAYDNTFNLRY